MGVNEGAWNPWNPMDKRNLLPSHQFFFMRLYQRVLRKTEDSIGNLSASVSL